MEKFLIMRISNHVYEGQMNYPLRVTKTEEEGEKAYAATCPVIQNSPTWTGRDETEAVRAAKVGLQRLHGERQTASKPKWMLEEEAKGK